MFIQECINPYFDLFQKIKEKEPQFQLEIRKKIIWAYSWAIPSPEVLSAIAQFSPIIEIGAGTGYWAWLLEQLGARVSAYDNEPLQPPHWHTMLKGNEKTVRDYSDHTLFLCWPPYQSKMAIHALKQYLGKRVVYVGEWEGRTADDEFHQQIKKDWKLQQTIDMPNWPGFQDRAYFFER